MRWPWERRERRERRQATGFTDLIVAGREAAAADGSVKASATAAVEAAAGAWARAFASASVENAPDDVIEAVSPTVLAQVGRDLVRRGEAVFVVDMARGGRDHADASRVVGHPWANRRSHDMELSRQR